MMDDKIIQDILTEVFSSFEPLDAQGSAVLHFLTAKGIVTDEELAPFLEQARNASSVRWLAARIRIGALMASALKPAEQPAKRDSKGDSGKTPEPAVEPAVEPPKVAAQKAQKEDASSESRAPQAAIGNPSPQKPESAPVKADKNPTAKGKTNSERSDQAEPKRAA